jgi:hypothetical protein
MCDVLVFTPVLRLEPETIKAIFGLEWGGALSVLFQRDNPVTCEDPREQAVRNHYHQYKRGRSAFLAGSYDAMLVIESDIVPPKDTLTRLFSLQADLAYGCYYFQKNDVVNVFERYQVSPGQPPARNIGESLSVRGLWPGAVAQGVIECSGGGLGCVLIQRHVLEAISFRIGWPESKAHCDSYFTIDVYKAGYSMKADTGVLCGHKTEEGVIKTPEAVLA